jgi:hypothetical protein
VIGCSVALRRPTERDNDASRANAVARTAAVDIAPCEREICDMSSQLHVLIGTNGEDRALLQAAARTGKPVPIPWVVPKAAAPGDAVALFLHSEGIVGQAEVLDGPIPGEFGNRRVHRAAIGSVELFAEAISIPELAAALPGWKWPGYPRSYTTPKAEFSSKLLGILDRRRRRSR